MIRWPNGVVCPKCGESEREPYRLKNQKRRLWKCRACRKQFTVTVGTIFESSHIGLEKRLLAFYLLCSSKKGMSAHQTASLHRRHVQDGMVRVPPHPPRHGERGFPADRIVEVDETYVGGCATNPAWGVRADRRAGVVALVERDGRAKSYRAPNVTKDELHGAVHATSISPRE